MTKAEYLVVANFCHIRCTSKTEKCKDCSIFKQYKEIYGEEEMK